MSNKEEFESLCREGQVSGPVSDQVIKHAEKELGVRFPQQYIDFLKEFGAVMAESLEIYGLPDLVRNDPPLWQCVVSVTKQLRSWGQAGADRASLIPISDDGTGVYFYLDTAVSPDTRILAIGPSIERTVSSNLYRFFIDLSKGKIVL